MTLNDLHFSESTPAYPLLFLGHGSPMNAIEDNAFVRNFKQVAKVLPTPKAVLCVSAHWETRGTRVTAVPKPLTIHDFSGFPPALYQVNYPAPGSPELAEHTAALATAQLISLDHMWGLDHGAWSVLRHIYPDADVPVVQLSLDVNKTPAQHLALAKELAVLRRRGVLVVGSGNVVHNLGAIAWDKLHAPYAFDWAQEAHHLIMAAIRSGDAASITGFERMGKAMKLAIPTPEHFLPLLYVLGMMEKDEPQQVFNDAPLGGSLYMTSLLVGKEASHLSPAVAE